MKIVANLPDINQLFNDGLKDIFPYSNIRVCVIHRVSGEILHIFRDIGKPIRFKDFAFNIKEHDLGLYVPSFYAKRNWKSGDICEDSILTIGANTISFNGYDAMPIFIRPDGTVRKYVVVGLTRGVMDNGVLRSIPGRYPSSGYTIEEFRAAVRKGRDPKKWGLMNQDMFDCLQLLFKFAFQVTKTKEALGNGLGREKSLTGGTLVLGGQSGYTDPFQFGKDKPDARLKSLICVVDGRLQFSNWDGKFSPIKIANNKTLDECIVEETEDYIIYSDGDKTELDPIPEGIYFACRVDKHTGEIYYGEGYENLANKFDFTKNEGTWGMLISEMFEDNCGFKHLVLNGASTHPTTPATISHSDYMWFEKRDVLFLKYETSDNIRIGIGGLAAFLLEPNKVHKLIINETRSYTINLISKEVSQVFNNEEVSVRVALYVEKYNNYVINKCPIGKITLLNDSNTFNSTIVIDNQELNYTSLHSITVTRDESLPATELTSNRADLKMIANRPDLNQQFLDKFTENGLYPFNLMGRYILHKDTGEILERLSPFDSTLNFYGAKSIFDPAIHDIHTLFFPFYAKRTWSGEFLSDTMVFEIPKTTHRNGFEVMPVFRDANGNLRPFVSCGAFKGSVVDGQLRSIPEKLPIVNLTIDQARTYARTIRDSKFNIETLDFITMVQFLYKIAFQDLNSQKILGNGWTNKPDKVKTGATMCIGNKSGSHDNPFFNGDVPDNRLKASLVYVNGRLEYYTDPNEPIEIEIANNKTLDECIVEETEDYIIYSDGEVTPENPIPEGIYFACRVDKHTGEIYYGEGYENYAFLDLTTSKNDFEGSFDSTTKETTLINPNTHGSRSIKFSKTLNTSLSKKILMSCLIKELESAVTIKTLWRLNDINRNGTVISKDTFVLDQFVEDSGENLNDSLRYYPTGLSVNNSSVLIKKPMVTFSDHIKPYVERKCPRGKISWKNADSITHLNHTFLIKNFKSKTSMSTSNIYFLDTMGGEVRTAGFNNDEIYSGDVCVSNTCKLFTNPNGSEPIVYTNIPKTLKLNSGDSISLNKYKSMSGFYIYKGDFTEAEFNSEIAKNIKPVSISRAKSTSNGNQVSLFGIEDFYGNIWSLVDGAVIKDNGIFYTMDPNDYGFNGDRYNKHIEFTPTMGANAGEHQSGYIKNIQKIDGFINYPREVSGSSETYYSDHQLSHRRGQSNIILFGARYDDSLRSGCFYWYYGWIFSSVHAAVSCRLTYLPEGIPNTNTEEV